MTEKVLVMLWSNSSYDSLRGLLLLASAELSDIGFEVIEVQMGLPGWEADLVEIIKKGGIIGALGMSGLGCDMETGTGQNLWEATRIPFFNWNCDHACYYPPRHVSQNTYLMHGYVFPDHAQYALEHFNPNGATYSAHLAMPTRKLFSMRPLNVASRNGRVMFTKSGSDLNKIVAIWRKRPALIYHILVAAAEELFDTSTSDVLPVVQRVAETYGIHLAGNSAITMILMAELDRFIRFKRANLVADVASRFPVDIYGSGWDHFDLPAGSQARFHGSLHWIDIMKQLPNYLGCLSTNPLIEHSVHDRVFFALSAGVVPISNNNLFSRTHMPLLSPYSYDMNKDSIAGALDALFTNPNEALQKTDETWLALQPRYTLRRSVEQIISLFRMAKMNSRVTTLDTDELGVGV